MSTTHRLAPRFAVLLASLMATVVACPSTVEYVGVDPADELGGVLQTNRELLTVFADAMSDPLRLEYSDSDPTSMLRYPALQFDLSAVPSGAVIHAAYLRLRRSIITWDGDDEPPDDLPIEVVNVNAGLRVDEVQSIREVLTIQSASRTENESEVWAEVGRTVGPAVRGIELANAVYRERTYVDLLARWNETATVEMTTTGAWDELVVTDLVRSEVQGDRSLTLLLRSQEDELTLEWYGLETIVAEGPDPAIVRPRLVVEYDFGEISAQASEPAHTEGSGEGIVEGPGPSATLQRTVVIFSSEPSGARIFIDDAFVGTTIEGELVEIPLTEESVSVRLVLFGYVPFEETLRLFPGSEQRIHAILQPELSPPDASTR